MNYTQNSKIMQVTEKTLVVGIDIASEDHYARVFDWRGIELGKVLSFENTIEGFNKFSDWIEKIKTISGKTKVIVGAEPTGHYWFGLAGYLKEKEMKLVLVNPFHVKRSKELDDNSPTKTDRKDPKTIAKLVIDGRYSEPYIPQGIYADLRIINEIRLRLTKEMIGIKNRVESFIDLSYKNCIISSRWAVSSGVERYLDMVEVRGSSPLPPTTFSIYDHLLGCLRYF